jgi:hypothetical protein
MGSTSTQFISYHKIRTDNTDLFEDAWGFNSEFDDVIKLLDKLKPYPGKKLTDQVICKIRKEC